MALSCLKRLKIFVLTNIIFVLFSEVLSQEYIKGRVYEIDANGIKKGIYSVNVYWSNNKINTLTDENGVFSIRNIEKEDKLVLSYIGYVNDTILIVKRDSFYEVQMKNIKMLEEIVIEDKMDGNYVSKMTPHKMEVITSAGLKRLACCNLSESFENSGSVDVVYSDAITGTKQIQMLGLAGIYTQIMFENIPFIKGIYNNYGLKEVPGNWMESIQVSKGTASVRNGYESLTGQINVEYKKPAGGEPINLNVYYNNENRKELNGDVSILLNKDWSTKILCHYSSNMSKFDHNNDGFIDIPLNSQINFMNRWNQETKKGHWVIGYNYIKENIEGGEKEFDKERDYMTTNRYGIGNDIERHYIFSKKGFILDSLNERSLGIIVSGNITKLNSFYGIKKYNGYGRSIYSSIVYDGLTNIFNKRHLENDHRHENITSVGINYMYDESEEVFNNITNNKYEPVYGAFLEWTYKNEDKFTFIAGLRGDNNVNYGFIITPRVHIKWSIDKKTTFRLSCGSGRKSMNLYSEVLPYILNSRDIIWEKNDRMEKGYNYGGNVVKDIRLFGKESRITFDYYHTQFISQTIINFDKDHEKIYVENLNGRSYLNSYQVDFIIKPVKRLEITIVYRINDVKQTYNNTFTEKPMVNKNKGLITMSYSTPFDRWRFDYTLQYNGKMKLPDMSWNPYWAYNSNYSKNYFLMYFQVTRSVKRLDAYAGCENILDYKQSNPIIDSKAPFGKYFDGTVVWGPIKGRMFYIGIRYKIKY